MSRPQQANRKPLWQLLSAAAAGSSACEISGTQELSKPLKVYFKDHNNQPGCVTLPPAGDGPTELQPRALLDACSPVDTGLGRGAHSEKAVCRALQLPADRLGIMLSLTTSGTFPSKATMDDVKALMMPEAAGLIRAEPYALNVYSPDGFFKAHRDTPTSTDMFGSLVICLPTDFTGGQLIIRSPDLSTSVTHDWGSTSNDRLAVPTVGASTASSSCGGNGGCKLAWAVIRGDCEHEIKPVTTGHRVTLTYNLFTSANSSSQGSGSSAVSASAAAASTARESAFGAQLSAALGDATWYPEGVTLGLALEHSYEIYEPRAMAAPRCQDYYGRYCYNGCTGRCSQFGSSDGSSDDGDSEASKADSRQPYSVQPDSLQGVDLQLYREVCGFGLQVKILPVASLEEFEEEELQGAVSPSPLSPDKLAVAASFKNPTEGRGWFPPDDRSHWGQSWAEFVQRCIGWHGVEAAGISLGDVVWVKPPGKQHLRYRSPVEEMWGGRPHACVYAAAAVLVVEVPPVGTAMRQG